MHEHKKYHKNMKNTAVSVICGFLMSALLLAGCGVAHEQQIGAEEGMSAGNIQEIGTDSAEGSEGNESGETEEFDGTGIGEAADPDGSTVGDTEEAAGVPLHTDYVTDEMYERAVSYQQGDLTRLAAVMRKAQAGEDITVGVIGGSITEGYSASNREKNCYAYHMYEWWQERFPDITVNYVNAGIGGTSSYLGVHRVQEDLLDEKPDFVIVEFSVNDGNNSFYKKSYDNLLRRILLDENSPALMLLFTTQENGTNAQMNDALLGFGYKLPMISYGNAVLPSIEAGEFTWKDISPDNIHPNDRGHAIIGELLYRYLNDVYARLDEIPEEVTPFTAEAQTIERYMNGRVLDSQSLTPISLGSFEEKKVNWYYPNDWHTTGGEEAIVFEVEAANIGMLYQRTVDGTYGQFDVYIDGECVRTVDGNFVNGWGSATAEMELYTSNEVAFHRIEVRKNADSTGDLFTILGWLIS